MHFGSKKSAEKFDAQFNGVEENAEKCGHVISPDRRVAREGNSRRFLGCPCEWIDPEWKGREKTVSFDLARKNKELENQVEEREAEKQSMRAKHKVEKKMLARIHREQEELG
ncbi:hypothetical protein VPH35_134537 [Triticum aestivum]